MCTMSMVYDHFIDQFKDWKPDMGGMSWPPPNITPGDAEVARNLIESFRKAAEAAATVDALTKQKDCLDPEKAKLLEKIDRLEKIIDALLAKDASTPPAPTGH